MKTYKVEYQGQGFYRHIKAETIVEAKNEKEVMQHMEKFYRSAEILSINPMDEAYVTYGLEWIKEMQKLSKKQLENIFGITSRIPKKNQIELIREKLIRENKEL